MNIDPVGTSRSVKEVAYRVGGWLLKEVPKYPILSTSERGLYNKVEKTFSKSQLLTVYFLSISVKMVKVVTSSSNLQWWWW